MNEWLTACDVAINLRSPYWGETSASTLRILAAGTPVIVSNVGSFAELPAAACVKLSTDEADLPGASRSCYVGCMTTRSVGLRCASQRVSTCQASTIRAAWLAGIWQWPLQFVEAT